MIPALETLIPRKLTKANVIMMSAKAERTTAPLGARVLKIMKTTKAIKINEINIAICNCL